MTMNEDLSLIARTVVAHDDLHARWLNSLSHLELCGAMKIAGYVDPINADITVLKHATEEFRHAFYLKKLIGKLEGQDLPDYSDANLLAPVATRQLLNRLDVGICRLLTKRRSAKSIDRQGAYVLVTYAIEMRADELYGTYQDVLSGVGSKVNVKSIIAEEEGHLEEMTRMLEAYDPAWQELAAEACALEQRLFADWSRAVLSSLSVGSRASAHTF
jgi:hypothetical protein